MLRPFSTIAAVAAFLACAAGARAETAPSQSWPEQKCARYKQAWTDVLARKGTRGLGAEFVERHEAFLASGCTSRPDVCPRSAEELEVANILVLLAMNSGTASTFLPFSCRSPAAAPARS